MDNSASQINTSHSTNHAASIIKQTPTPSHEVSSSQQLASQQTISQLQRQLQQNQHQHQFQTFKLEAKLQTPTQIYQLNSNQKQQQQSTSLSTETGTTTVAKQLINDAHELFCNLTQSQQPKITVSLPKHAASRLLDLVKRRDIALLELGILSVQFEGDQVISLTRATTTKSAVETEQTNQIKQQSKTEIDIADAIVNQPKKNNNIHNDLNKQKQRKQSIKGIQATQSQVQSSSSKFNLKPQQTQSLPSPQPPTPPKHLPSQSQAQPQAPQSLRCPIEIIDCSVDNIDSSPFLSDQKMNNDSVVNSQQTNVTECASTVDEDCNAFHMEKSKSLHVHEVDDEDNQNNDDNFKIQLTHLDEFPDTIGLDMFDSDLLFPDYTLNLS